MIFFRIPYCYLINHDIINLHSFSHVTLYYIYDIHNNIPDSKTLQPISLYLNRFLYHPFFIMWVHEKTAQEAKLRGINHSSPIEERLLNLKSRNLSEMIPPNEKDLAAELYEYFQKKKRKTFGNLGKFRKLLPVSYIKLMEKYYNGFQINEADSKRIDHTSGRDYKDDFGWYRFSGEI